MDKKKKFLPKAEYPGGNKAMSKFISENLKYPESALKEKIEGTVALRLEINYQGKVVAVKVKVGLSPECNEEAVRLAHLLIFKVAKVHHVKIICYHNLNIHFKLPVQVQNTMMIQYTVTSNATNQKQADSNNKGGYSYSIKIE